MVKNEAKKRGECIPPPSASHKTCVKIRESETREKSTDKLVGPFRLEKEGSI